MAAPARVLIVNADDFGLSAGVNAGIIAAHEHGIVTSASLMVYGAAAPAAAAYARAHPALSLGLHVDLGEWVYRDATWQPLYERVPQDDAGAVAAEVDRQVATFAQLAGGPPTHLDSHQHAHLDEPLRGVLTRLATHLQVPLRRCSPHIQYCGDFYGQTAEGRPYPQGIGVESLIATLARLPPGVTELACHPALRDDLRETMYRTERVRETAVLCDPRVRAALAPRGIQLGAFARGPAGWVPSDSESFPGIR